MKSTEVLFAPAEFAALKQRDLSETLCVVFDVLRATSTMVTALDNRASAIAPVAEIEDALAFRRAHPQCLLAGERHGVRIRGTETGGIDFDLGNSPREFMPQTISGRTIVMTTTNGTRALDACAHANTVLAACFLNLEATAQFILLCQPARLLLVCSGTQDQAAYEDVLAAGGLCDFLGEATGTRSDSALIAQQLWHLARTDLPAALARSRNGRRLLGIPELRDDVPFCAQLNVLPIVARSGPDGLIRAAAIT